MKHLESYDLALLVLRLSIAFVFLSAAWKNTVNAAAWTQTNAETALLFRELPEPARTHITRLAAVAGMIMMYGGGLSLLLAVEPRLGGLAVAAFSAMGMAIHAIHRDKAKVAGENGDVMGWSAYGAHIASGRKNIALIGAGLAFFLAGAGHYGLGIDCTGRWLGLST
jgi:uncharacterized membrane protein YphA (DoxX/SURF4 family)